MVWRIAIIGLVIITFTACGTVTERGAPRGALTPEGQPEWATRLEYKPDVIETVGYSPEMPVPEISLKQSDAAAQAEMARVLGSAVKVSIKSTVLADRSLDAGIFDAAYNSVTKLYSQETISGLQIVDHYVDPHTGITYALARLSRADAVKDACAKARAALGESVSLIDQLALDAAIKGMINPPESEYMEATGYASIINQTGDGKSPDARFVAMRRADLDARAALAEQVKVKITSSIGEWVKAHRNDFKGESSVDVFYNDMVKAFANVDLEGSRIMERYFSRDTKLQYSKATASKKYVATQLINALAPIIQHTENRQAEEALNAVISKNLDILMEEIDAGKQ